MKIFAFVGKGGVGKSTLCCLWAHRLSKFGKTVVVSLDQQQNHVDIIQRYNLDIDYKILDNKINEFVDFVIKNTAFVHLYDYFETLAVDFMVVCKLAEMLHLVQQQYDYIVIDMPPNHSGLFILKFPSSLNNATVKALTIRQRVHKMVTGHDDVMERLEYLNGILEECKTHLKKAVFFPLAIATELGYIEMVKAYEGIRDMYFTVGPIIVNMVAPIPEVECECCMARYNDANEYLAIINKYANKHRKKVVQIPFSLDVDEIICELEQIEQILEEQNKLEG